MIFSLDVLRAHKGDCMLLHFGTKDEPGLIMIDGGPKDVYKPQLKPRLEAIRTARRLRKQDSLIVDLLMVSHVDDDHIQGILDLTGDEIAAKQTRRPRLLNVQSFWHNSFDEVIGHKPDELTANVKTQFGPAAVSGSGDLSDDKIAEVEENTDENREVVTSSLKILASIEQGFRLRQEAEALGFPHNPEFGGKLVMARRRAEPVPIGQRLKLTVVGPMQAELEALHNKHQNWLRDLKAVGKSPPQALAAYIDKSVPNLSSIVVLAEAGGKRMLLTGDARGDKILEGLKLVGLLGRAGKGTLEVDVLKVPHHGSANNLETGFFERVRARHYVFSGDGKHGNPERKALEMLFAARGDGPFVVHLTYPIAKIDAERKRDWESEQAKEKARRKKNPKLKVREKWSRKRHSLEALFETLDLMPGQEIRIVGSEAHVVDLLDPVQF